MTYWRRLPMSLIAGARLGPYEIVAPLGAGGMGEVYRARDTKLNRDVAIKVLPEMFAADAGRLARFNREAQVLASLNHPNIAAVYGIEGPSTGSGQTAALVMELVEGEDLSVHIARGAIPFADALPIARQIADALEAAHEAGIVHRDLKPANIKVRDDGTVKVLDFGLAKVWTPDAGPGTPDSMNSPTLTSPATALGMILGTAAYMAPEQAKGRAVDRRADIWAFGVVLYEMVTGRRLFQGEDVSETLAAVLRQDVDLAALPASTPPALKLLIARCLDRDLKRRLQHIGEARIVLEDPSASAVGLTSPATGPIPRPSVWRRILPIGLTAIVVGAIGVGAWFFKPAPAVVNVLTRFDHALPEGTGVNTGGRRFVAISPDGRRIAYAADRQIYLREMSQLIAQPIAGTNEFATGPVFSPDGEWIAYFAGVGSGLTLKKIRVSGGTPVRLCATTAPYGASWRGDTIVFGQNTATFRGIQAVADTGGTPRTLATVGDAERAAQPQLLGDGQHVLFTVKAFGSIPWDDGEIVVQAVNGGARTVLVRGGTDGRIVADGRLVYYSRGTLFGIAFDARALAVRGGPVPVVEGVRGLTAPFQSGAGVFSVADSGTLVYVEGGSDGTRPSRQLVWVDRQGKEEPLAVPTHAYSEPRLSPDGTRLVVNASDGENDLWVWNFKQETLTRLTFGPESEGRARWTSDGRHLVFNSNLRILRVAADVAGTPDQMLDSKANVSVGFLSPDGRSLVYRAANPGTGNDLMAISIETGAQEPRPLIHSPFQEVNAAIAPNGRWMAYQSDESGQWEVYVRPFPAVETSRWQVSSAGGYNPEWSRGGDELFFGANPVGSGPLVAVPVNTNGATFTFGKTHPLFTYGRYDFGYDVSLDGKRFLMTRGGPAADAATSTTRPSLTIVTHWLDELKARVK